MLHLAGTLAPFVRVAYVHASAGNDRVFFDPYYAHFEHKSEVRGSAHGDETRS